MKEQREKEGGGGRDEGDKGRKKGEEAVMRGQGEKEGEEAVMKGTRGERRGRRQ